MATVPRVQSLSNVELRPVSGTLQSVPNATPGAFGADAAQQTIQGARQLGAAADRIGQIALEIKHDDDVREAKDADIAFRQAKLGLLRGDGTQENPGFFGAMGQNAVDGYGGSREALSKVQRDIASGIKSDKARRMFSDSANAQVLEADEQMINHVSRQRTVAQNATAQSRVESAVSEASLFPNDPKVVSKSVGIAEAEAAGVAARNGFDKETSDRAVVEARTKVVKSAIISAIDGGDDRTAERLFLQYASGMDGREAAVLRKNIEEKAIVAAAQTLGDKYYAMVNPNDPTTVTKALAQVRKDLNGKEEVAVVAELNNRVRELFGAQDQAMQVERYRQAEADRAAMQAARERAETQRAERNAISAEKLAVSKRLAEIREEQAKVRSERAQLRDEERASDRAERIVERERSLAREQRQLEDRATRAGDRERDLLRRQTQDAEKLDERERRQTAVDVAETLARQGGTFEEQRAKAQEVAQGDMLLQVERILRQRATDDKRVQDDTNRANAEKALEYVEAGTPVDKIPTELWNSIPPSKRLEIRDRADKLARGEPEETNWEAFETYTTMSPDELRNVDLSVAVSELAKPQFVVVQRQVVAARAGRADTNVTDDGRAIKAALDATGLKNGKGQLDDRGRLFTAINAEVQARREASPGGRLSNEDRDKAIKYSVDQYILKGGSWSRTREQAQALEAQVGVSSQARAAAQLRPQTNSVASLLGADKPFSAAEELRIQETTFASIPPAARRGIVSVLRDNGVRAPSQLEVRAAYVLGLRPVANQGE